jgi:hypothetical protein
LRRDGSQEKGARFFSEIKQLIIANTTDSDLTFKGPIRNAKKKQEKKLCLLDQCQLKKKQSLECDKMTK